MGINGLIDYTLFGNFVAQSFFHALVAALVVDRSVQGWKISDPRIKQRFALLVIVLPVALFPLYEIINPERRSIYFHFDALFDGSRWFALGLWKLNIGHLFFIISVLTGIVFILQEMVPVIRHIMEKKRGAIEGEKPKEGSLLYHVISGLPGNKPDFLVINDDDLIIFSDTGKKPIVYVSTGLIKALGEEQLRAAIAHELAHVERGRNRVLSIAFILRSVMFLNPVVLLEFRRAVREEEKICDDIAVSLTKNPSALAGTLRLFHNPEVKIEKGVSLRMAIEEYSHSIHIRNRIERLEGETERGSAGWFEVSVTALSIAVINYFVV